MLCKAFPALGTLAIRNENTNRERCVNNGYEVESTLAERFRQRNARDYMLYDEAMEIFERQKQKFGMKRNADE
jgi:hypothetical protein